MVGEINKDGLCRKSLTGCNPRGMRMIHTTSASVWLGLPKPGPNHPPDLRAPHLRLVGLWSKFEDTGQPLRPEEQSQGQGPRVSVLWWILADVPL